MKLLAPFAAKDGSEDSLTVMRRVADFYDTHQGENRVVVAYPAPTPVPASAAANYIHLPQYPMNGTQLECDGSELRPDGTCAKCERINDRIEAALSIARANAIDEAIRVVSAYFGGLLSMGVNKFELVAELEELKQKDPDH